MNNKNDFKKKFSTQIKSRKQITFLQAGQNSEVWTKQIRYLFLTSIIFWNTFNFETSKEFKHSSRPRIIIGWAQMKHRNDFVFEQFTYFWKTYLLFILILQALRVSWRKRGWRFTACLKISKNTFCFKISQKFDISFRFDSNTGNGFTYGIWRL